MIFRVNENKKISIYDYYVTNACVLQFINVEDEDVIKDFFKGLEVESFDILDDETEKIKDHREMNVKYTHYVVENTEIIEYEYKVIQEAYDEEVVIDEETQETETIHHEAIIQKIEKRIPVEMTSVFLEVPSIETTVSSVKSQVKEFQKAVPNSVQFQSFVDIVCESFTDEQALLVPDFYEDWEGIPEEAELKEGRRLRYKGLLYKVKDGQTHQKQSDWNPKDAATLFEVIEPNHLGTKEDPIPAHANMEYFKDKYYIENDVIYLCNSELAANGVVLQYTPSQLVNIYFIKVEE